MRPSESGNRKEGVKREKRDRRKCYEIHTVLHPLAVEKPDLDRDTPEVQGHGPGLESEANRKNDLLHLGDRKNET